MASSVSTLSTGLNKSDEFIKEHAVRLHSRALTFKNGQILYLNEDSAIPAVSNNDHTRYFRCQSITYFQDYDTCHSNITLQIVTTDGAKSDVVVNKTTLNQMGLIQALNDSIFTVTPGLRLVHKNSSAQDYNGMRIFADSTIQAFKINHEGAWLLGILSKETLELQRINPLRAPSPSLGTLWIDSRRCSRSRSRRSRNEGRLAFLYFLPRVQ